jgi:XapX domain-containing protein
MKIALSFVLALAIGAATRVFGVPLPAPPALVGALLVLAMTLGHLVADEQIARRTGSDVGDEGLADDPTNGGYGR